MIIVYSSFSVFPSLFNLILNGILLGYLYKVEQNDRFQANKYQQNLEEVFETIHNGPLQTIAILLRKSQDNNLIKEELITKLSSLNSELRELYKFLKLENSQNKTTLYLENRKRVNLNHPLHEILYEVYNQTIAREFYCFQTLKIKICTFDPIDAPLTIEQKRQLCRFLEEALCNVGKYAIGVTRLKVIYTKIDGEYSLSIADNGQGITSKKQGIGTQQAKNIARQLKGKFQRVPLWPKGVLCELTWPVDKL